MRVLVCDDHALMVRILSEHLRRDGFEVLTAESPEQALEQQRATPADLCVLDLRFANSALDGVHALRGLLALTPRLRVLLLTGHADSALARRALAAGAHALLDKNQPLEVVRRAVRQLALGEVVPTPSTRGPASAPPELSSREREVLTLLVGGCSTPHIAAVLGISVQTVRKHVQRLLGKLGVATRLEAVAVAVRDGLVLAHEPEYVRGLGRHDPADAP